MKTKKFKTLWPFLSSHNPEDFNDEATVIGADGNRYLVTSMPDVPGYWLYDAEAGVATNDDPFDTISEAIDYVKNN